MLRKGVSPYIIRWILTWIANRENWVAFDAAKSMKTKLRQGVPQGSVLSPQLFIFYFDDLHWGSGDLQVSFFADDAAIWAQDNKLHIAEKRLQQGMDSVATWIKEWKMLLTDQNSECSFFSSTNLHE